MSRESSTSELKRTALHDRHQAAGARMVDFGGWDMPLQYTGIADEHLAVRTRAGLFDVSHMGEIELAGSDALAAVQHMTSNDASRLEPGQIQYSLLTTPEGTVVDDVLVYRWADAHYLLVVNAANIRKDAQWISARAADSGGDVAVVNTSNRYALIALQGPAAVDVLTELATVDLATLKYYRFVAGEVAGARSVVSRTGYTGEEGFEIFVPPAQAGRVWDAIVEAGRAVDLRLCGLGARDTLRLEAGMRLYGNEMDESVTALEGGLESVIAWAKPAFVGHEALRRERERGSARRLVAFEMIDRAIARPGHAVINKDVECGHVTSGTQTPFLKKAIGLALVPSVMATVGGELTIDVRGRRAEARIVPEPFYSRRRQRAQAVVPGESLMYPTDRKYTSEHEWVRTDESSGEATIGITHFAQDQLGDVVYVELPDVGRTLAAGETFGSIESVKTVSDLFAPIAGEVIAVNGELATAPEKVNQAPHDTWMIRVRPSGSDATDNLLDAAAYEALLN